MASCCLAGACVACTLACACGGAAVARVCVLTAATNIAVGGLSTNVDCVSSSSPLLPSDLPDLDFELAADLDLAAFDDAASFLDNEQCASPFASDWDALLTAL